MNRLSLNFQRLMLEKPQGRLEVRNNFLRRKASLFLDFAGRVRCVHGTPSGNESPLVASPRRRSLEQPFGNNPKEVSPLRIIRQRAPRRGAKVFSTPAASIATCCLAWLSCHPARTADPPTPRRARSSQCTLPQRCAPARSRTRAFLLCGGLVAWRHDPVSCGPIRLTFRRDGHLPGLREARRNFPRPKGRCQQ